MENLIDKYKQDFELEILQEEIILKNKNPLFFVKKHVFLCKKSKEHD